MHYSQMKDIGFRRSSMKAWIRTLAEGLMLNAAIVGLGWRGKELVKAVEDSAYLRFARGVTLEPQYVRDFATEHNILIGIDGVRR
jgi:hypothetical protein